MTRSDLCSMATTAFGEVANLPSDSRNVMMSAAGGNSSRPFNRGDFYGLHTAWLRSGRSHAGIVLSRQDLSVGEQMRRLLRLISRLSAEEMRNRVEFLSRWGEG